METNIVNGLLNFTVLLVFYMLFFRVFVRLKLRNPKTYTAYLQKLALISKKHEYEFFRIAAKEFNISGDRTLEDYKRFVGKQIWGKGDEAIPHYLKVFLDEGKEKLDEIKLSLFF
jgi:hypothetical protein